MAPAFAFVNAIISLTNRRRNKMKKQPKQKVEQISDTVSGQPLLVQSGRAKHIRMQRLVGKGRYGNVWLAKWRDEEVAVKTFPPTEKYSWIRETEIYQTALMKHENILNFMAADIRSNGSCPQMMIITEYHERGSLHDYLSTTIINPQKMLLLAYSLASGLAHLHDDISGTPGKPEIAHRDIKSKNILVNQNGQCVIADFGLAIKNNLDLDEINIALNTRVGTRRYMSPEVLNRKLNPHHFEEFKRADMYSVGLVLWEMARRCHVPVTGLNVNACEDYAVPYHDVVPSNPTFEDMHAVVCVMGLRPSIPSRWQEDDVLATLAKIMEGCWHSKSTLRFTAQRLKKSLGRMKADYEGRPIEIV